MAPQHSDRDKQALDGGDPAQLPARNKTPALFGQ